jgi:poly-gamma-glutamate synthesis protein (capsule biosynthesis protein)
MKFFLFTFLIILVVILHIYTVSQGNKVKSTQSDSTITITISAVGDIMCHSPQYEYAKVEKDSFDFNPVFRKISQHLSESDFTFGNLETVFAGKGANYTGYPLFNSPNQLADALKNAGFDLLTTSNNHSLDRGEAGIRQTIADLSARNIHYNGTYVTQRDRDSIRIFNIKGISIAFIAYSYGTNGNPIPKGKSYLINLIDYDLIQQDINAAKSKNPDLIIVHYHFGEEYQREPNAFQKEVVDRTVEMGADIIIGGHPHVLQPMQFLKSGKSVLDSVFIAYSLGNFISNQRKKYTDAGGILTLNITKNLKDRAIKVSSVEFTPTWVYKGNTGIKNEFLILPSISSLEDTSLSFLKKSDFKNINESIGDSKEVTSIYSCRITYK